MNKSVKETNILLGGLGFLAALLGMFIFNTGAALIVCEAVMLFSLATYFGITLLDAFQKLSQGPNQSRTVLKIGFSAIGLLALVGAFLLPPLGLTSVISAIIFASAVSLAALIAIQITDLVYKTSKVAPLSGNESSRKSNGIVRIGVTPKASLEENKNQQPPPLPSKKMNKDNKSDTPTNPEEVKIYFGDR